VELLGNVIDKLKRGKAAGLDSFLAEHLIYCHPILLCNLAKLFNSMLRCSYLPVEFGLSYTAPLPIVSGYRTKSQSYSDFCDIAISSIISKVFEHCILFRYDCYFRRNANQFGFKRGIGCSQAVYTFRKIVTRFVDGGSTVYLCALDLSKAFDKVNNAALDIKLMKRRLPARLLDLLVYWFDNCSLCEYYLNSLNSILM